MAPVAGSSRRKESVVFDNRVLVVEIGRMLADTKKNRTHPVPALFRPMPSSR